MTPKDFVRTAFPSGFYALRNLRHKLRFGDNSYDAIFSTIYEKNLWGSKESASGTGSEIHGTAMLRDVLEKWLNRNHIKSLVDIPCGDFNWMKLMRFPEGMKYTGIDIVKQVIASNAKRYSKNNVEFCHGDILTSDLPTADAYFCKDLFIHFPNTYIKRAIERLKNTRSRFLLAGTSPHIHENEDIKFGQCRAVNMELDIFGLGKASELIKYYDPSAKEEWHLGIWHLTDMKAPPSFPGTHLCQQ